ncbi:trehalose operon repressor [uncultured Clostridium sp.]|uniref:trehalose operon repressor n=1 Tax=uncultured Clostridium sp. TaxID=59620 RepID=UPI0026033E00|nr:trehalose operon repressor [uncultured Clostridium sp.]
MESKYLKIYNEVISEIENGILEPSEKLSSETEMMEKYSVSRDTVRKALNKLEQNGYIIKKKGKGSFVLEMARFDFPLAGVVSFKELAQKMNGKIETHLERFNLITEKHSIRKKLKCEDDIWEVIRVREINGERIILDKDYLNRSLIPNLTKEVCKNSIYEYIENVLELKIAFARKEITVRQVTEEDKRLLNLEDFNCIVVCKSYTYLENGELFQYTESRHRPDKFKFMEFARRK